MSASEGRLSLTMYRILGGTNQRAGASGDNALDNGVTATR